METIICLIEKDFPKMMWTLTHHETNQYTRPAWYTATIYIKDRKYSGKSDKPVEALILAYKSAMLDAIKENGYELPLPR
jgi:hypothetical protein